MAAHPSAVRVLIAVGALWLGGCTPDASPTTIRPAPTSTTTNPSPTPAPTTTLPAGTITIWIDEQRATAIADTADRFRQLTGAELEIEVKGYAEIRDRLAVDGPAGSGPDLFVNDHLWVGELADSGLVSPIELETVESQFFSVAVDAFRYRGAVYGLPLSMESIALYFNPDLAGSDPPLTLDDVVAICEDQQPESCIGIPGGGGVPDAYHQYPFLASAGGGVFGRDPESGYDASVVTLDRPETIAGAQRLAGLVEADLVPSLDYEGAKRGFLSGTQPFWITGPWERSVLAEQAAVPWRIARLPEAGEDGPMPPLVGVQGLFVSAFSDESELAQRFLTEIATTLELAQRLYEIDGRSPALLAAFDLVAADETALAFAASAADGHPIPNVPEMGAVWGPLGDALAVLRDGDISAEVALEMAAAEVRAALER